MLSTIRSRLTYANVISTVCLFIVLGGTSYAVATGSIDSREIKNSTIRSKDIRNNQVSAADVRDSSLLARDFRPGQLPAGPRGPQGAQGAPGPKGDTGAAGATNVRRRIGPEFVINPDTAVDATATCNAGERAVGGGGITWSGPGPADFDMTASYPTIEGGNLSAVGVPTGWVATYFNRDVVTNDNLGPITVRAYVICAAP